MNGQDMLKFETYLLKQVQKEIENENSVMVVAITELYKAIVR